MPSHGKLIAMLHNKKYVTVKIRGCTKCMGIGHNKRTCATRRKKRRKNINRKKENKKKNA